jgi:hypothetical protein
LNQTAIKKYMYQVHIHRMLWARFATDSRQCD